MPNVVAAAHFDGDHIFGIRGVHHEGGVCFEKSDPVRERVVPRLVRAPLILAPLHVVQVAVSEILSREASNLRALPNHRELGGYVSYKHGRGLIFHVDDDLDPLRNLESLQAREVRGILPVAVISVGA